MDKIGGIYLYVDNTKSSNLLLQEESYTSKCSFLDSEEIDKQKIYSGKRIKNPELFNGVPKPPRYKHKNGEFMLVFTNQQCSIDDGILKFPKIMDLELCPMASMTTMMRMFINYFREFKNPMSNRALLIGEY